MGAKVTNRKDIRQGKYTLENINNLTTSKRLSTFGKGGNDRCAGSPMVDIQAIMLYLQA